MALDKAVILAQIDDLLTEFRRAKDAAAHDEFSGGLPDEELQQISTRFRAGLRRLAPVGSVFVEGEAAIKGNGAHAVRDLGGILHALRADVEAGYTQNVVELVHADVFADFLAMAAELQRSSFKDAAAVIAGSTLEEHLRKLAAKAQLPTTNQNGEPLKASRLNDDLKKANVYNPLQPRSVQAWLDLRNAAAHGEYDEYEHAQVASMIRSVGEFMNRYAA